ncbi:MAG: thymidylate synthase [Candidatus Yanofskybacteria bacterium CG10_big_fil_rev_8_21_14_0_10_46_23]|uniref:Thymidylate synthase n=1 Tax=Candidatus Yanofskybacteria bacterium CG10_big_fil_rev_8_21_14_0_10_46_23 TaxID=1975098 RepID=A0A2H0R3Z8_9BACT|nr:MAG: thymidylate synthase [Candidatus Yanofskybacteria bacterium CG10_big_fil_rev_8_21_14_0_10_46_23]
MRPYLDLLGHVLENGIDKSDRTGIGTRSVFGHQMRFNLRAGFPLVTTKKMFLKGIIVELLWLISGQTNIRAMTDQGVHIWDAWADVNGELGPVYGSQWRSWPDYGGGTIDQLKMIIERIKTKPDDRRLIVSAWNVALIEDMRLPPCHLLFQFYVANGRLSCQMYQRSCDLFLGVPFNIASYSLLTMMVAQVCSLEYGEFIWVGGDCHIYSNHFDQVKTQLCRKPFDLPSILIDSTVRDIDGFSLSHFEMVNYQSHPHIPAPIAV